MLFWTVQYAYEYCRRCLQERGTSCHTVMCEKTFGRLSFHVVSISVRQEFGKLVIITCMHCRKYYVSADVTVRSRALELLQSRRIGIADSCCALSWIRMSRETLSVLSYSNGSSRLYGCCIRRHNTHPSGTIFVYSLCVVIMNKAVVVISVLNLLI